MSKIANQLTEDKIPYPDMDQSPTRKPNHQEKERAKEEKPISEGSETNQLSISEGANQVSENQRQINQEVYQIINEIRKPKIIKKTRFKDSTKGKHIYLREKICTISQLSIIKISIIYPSNVIEITNPLGYLRENQSRSKGLIFCLLPYDLAL
ncbi:hypothetical protein HAX54_022921 [Datura stramonium]|uniref:Uncharacterized protein n=1 Tax=Datura stramonium TaxID=4076 RepID=A0ABS8UXB6_DATST|nr:hypothetical protein [Datura stramonium]